MPRPPPLCVQSHSSHLRDPLITCPTPKVRTHLVYLLYDSPALCVQGATDASPQLMAMAMRCARWQRQPAMIELSCTPFQKYTLISEAIGLLPDWWPRVPPDGPRPPGGSRRRQCCRRGHKLRGRPRSERPDERCECQEQCSSSSNTGSVRPLQRRRSLAPPPLRPHQGMLPKAAR